MLKALREGSHRPKIVGLMSCSSMRWYRADVKQAETGAGFLGTTDTFYTKETTMADGFALFLKKTLGFECLEGYEFKDVSKKASMKLAGYWSIPKVDTSQSDSGYLQRILPDLFSDLTNGDLRIQQAAYSQLKTVPVQLLNEKQIQALREFQFGKSFSSFFQ